MGLREESGRDLGVGLRHSVAIDHASDVSRVSWHLLATNHVCRASHPVLGPFAGRAVHVLVHLGARWQVDLAHHALFERNSAHIDLVATRLIDLPIDRTGRLAEQIVLERNMAGVPGQVLAGPHAGSLGPMLGRLCSRLLLHLRRLLTDELKLCETIVPDKTFNLCSLLSND